VDHYARLARQRNPRCDRPGPASQPGAGAVVLPHHLVEAALAAWQRDEEDPLPPSETEAQRRIRGHAAPLALIGLRIEQRAVTTPDTVTSDLNPDLITAATAAAQRT